MLGMLLTRGLGENMSTYSNGPIDIETARNKDHQ